MDLDFEKICRTCLSSESSLISIFENNIIEVAGSESTTTVIDLLTTLTDIKISTNDCLPGNICPACLEEIKRAYSFKLKCENSEAVLNRYLQDYCKKLVEKADSSGVAKAKIIPKSENSRRQATSSLGKDADKGTSSCIKEETITGHDDDDEVVCLSDDDEEDCGENDQSKQNLALSNESTMEPEQIEISDDDEEDDNDYNFDSGYALDEDSFQDNSENISDSQSPFAIQDYYSLQGFDSDYVVCSVCSQMFQTTNELKRHIKDCHTEGLTCNICQREFSNSSNLFEHCSIHIPVCYPCPICGYKLKQEKYLKKHLERHARDKEVKCDLCDQLFLTTSEMRVHVLLNHTEEIDSTYKCNTCGLKLPNADLLESHKEKHKSVIRNHICDVCSKAFRSKTKLTEHYRLHTGEKPYVCQYCHKQFRLQFSLRMHLAIHTNEHFFKCRICFMAFRQRSELQKHIQMHRDMMI